jgi:DNA polymerase III alpha subunit
MIVSPHCHAESPLTGSTLANLVKRAKDLGRTHFAYTDHGHLSSALKAYTLSKKAGLKFIPGLEIYFKDNKCPITAGTKVDRCKYFTATLYCQDQEAYQELCKIVSRTDFPTIDIYEEKQQVWGWEDLERIAKFNTQIVLSGVHCMVGKTMLAGCPDLGEMIFTHLKSIFKDRMSVALLCEPWTKKYSQIVEVISGDQSITVLASDIVSTDKARKIKAMDLVEKDHHSFLKSTYSNNCYNEYNLPIEKVKLHKGFLPLPGGDASLKVNKFLKALASKHGVSVLATDYAYYAAKEDKIVQTMRLEGNNKLQPNLHMKTRDEMLDYLCGPMGIGPAQAELILANTDAWASKFDGLTLKYDWRLADTGENPLNQVMDIIKQNGRMRWDDPKYVDRLREELNVIAKNGIYDLTGYFLPIRDVLNFYKENGFLTGPGRGSAGGALLCYLLGITQIDPFDYDLPFQRFFSMVRIKQRKLPDIDVDLEDRVPLVGEDGHSGYLYGRYKDKAAQISTRTTIRLKSAILDTNRYFKGKVEEEVATFSKGLPAPPQGINDINFVFGYDDDEGHHVPGLIELSTELQNYAEERKEEWEIVSQAMGLTRAFSKHASAFVLSDVPIQDVVPTKDGNVAQYEAKECEAAGLIKYDFLVIKQLKDIRVCLDIINKKNGEKNTVGYFNHKGKNTYVWKLPQDDEVYRSIWTGQTETCFQINTRSMIPFVIDMLPENMMDLATLLALVRPGPMDFIDPHSGRNMVEEYMLRRRGEAQPDIQELADLLPSTFGIIAFQEQLNIIARDLAGMSAEDAEVLRENMAKKKMVDLMKMKPMFMAGAKNKVSEEIAEGIWERMVTFGRYGFSVIHAVEYAHVTFACMFLKHHYPLEWWAAILTNADEKEITGKFWPYVKDMVLPPDINLSGDTMVVDYDNQKIRAKLGIVRGMGEATIEPIVSGRPYKDIQDFVNKEVAGPALTCKLIHVGILDSLFPGKKTLQEKLKAYADAVEIKAYNDKVEEAAKKGKKPRATQPKDGQIPEGYLNLHPLKDAAMRKSVLPSMPIDLYALGAQYSKVLAPLSGRAKAVVISNRGHETPLIRGAQLQRLDEVEGDKIEDNIYVAATCYVIEAKEFPYAKNKKRALKMVLDADGYISEKVLWPDYESGELIYPKELKKGAIATIFFRKKPGRKDMSIQGVVVESADEPKPESQGWDGG